MRCVCVRLQDDIFSEVRSVIVQYMKHFTFMDVAILKTFMTKLTDKMFPVVRIDVLSFLLVFLAFEPLSQTIEMDVFHSTSALTH